MDLGPFLVFIFHFWRFFSQGVKRVEPFPALEKQLRAFFCGRVWRVVFCFSFFSGLRSIPETWMVVFPWWLVVFPTCFQNVSIANENFGSQLVENIISPRLFHKKTNRWRVETWRFFVPRCKGVKLEIIRWIWFCQSIAISHDLHPKK